MANRARTMKVDIDLADIIEEIRDDQNLSFREASREVAKSIKNKKIKEPIF